MRRNKINVKNTCIKNTVCYNTDFDLRYKVIKCDKAIVVLQNDKKILKLFRACRSCHHLLTHLTTKQNVSKQYILTGVYSFYSFVPLALRR